MVNLNFVKLKEMKDEKIFQKINLQCRRVLNRRMQLTARRHSKELRQGTLVLRKVTARNGNVRILALPKTESEGKHCC